MKSNIETMENISINLALYAFALYFLHLEIFSPEPFGVKALFEHYISYSQTWGAMGVLPVQILISLKIIAIIAIITISLLPLINNACLKKISPYFKIAILIIGYKFFMYIGPSFNLTLHNQYRNPDLYSYDYIVNVLKLLIISILTPGFFFSNYRKYFSLSKINLFILMIGLTSFLNIFLHLFNLYFLSFFVDILTVAIVFFVLLPYAPLNKHLQEKFKINEETKFKIVIFLYFLGQGLINIEYRLRPADGVIFILIALLVALSMSRWFMDNCLHHDSSILKKIYSVTFFVIVGTLLYRIGNSFEECQKYQISYYNTLARLSLIQIIDNEIEIEAYDSDSENLKLPKTKLQNKLTFFKNHIGLANDSFEDLTEIQGEILRQSFHNINEDYNQANIYLLDAYNDLLKYETTKQIEYKLDYYIHINDFKLQHSQINAEFVEIYTLLDSDKQRLSLFKSVVKNLSSYPIK